MIQSKNTNKVSSMLFSVHPNHESPLGTEKWTLSSSEPSGLDTQVLIYERTLDLRERVSYLAQCLLEVASAPRCALESSTVREKWMACWYGKERKIVSSRTPFQLSLATLEASGKPLPEHFTDRGDPSGKVRAAKATLESLASGSSLADKKLGVILGQAVGDGLGLTTEFMSREQAQNAIAQGPLEYTTRQETTFATVDPRRSWRLNFPFYGFTDDTDQAVMVVRAFQRAKTDPTKTADQHFACLLTEWLHHGLEGRDFTAQQGGREHPRFSVPACLGLGSLVSAVLQQSRYREKPQEAALAVWKDPRLAYGSHWDVAKKPAANGALMRTSPIAVLFDDLDSVVKASVTMCNTTHADPRCVASCVAANVAIFALVHGDNDVEHVKELAYERGKKAMDEAMIRLRDEGVDFSLLPEFSQPDIELREAIWPSAQTWQQLDLEDGAHGGVAIGYTYKCLSAAFFALKEAATEISQGHTPEEAIRTCLTHLVREGGDADTNGTIAAAMVGAYSGFHSFPESWRLLRDQPILLEVAKEMTF